MSTWTRSLCKIRYLGKLSFEKAPFKLTYDMVEVMGGKSSKGFAQYQELVASGLLALQKYAQKVLYLIERQLFYNILTLSILDYCLCQYHSKELSISVFLPSKNSTTSSSP